MQRNAFANYGRAYRSRANEFRARIRRGCSPAFRHVQQRSNSPKSVGECHVRTAMQSPAGGAEVPADYELGNDSLGREFDDAYPDEPRKQRIEDIVKRFDCEHGGLLGHLTRIRSRNDLVLAKLAEQAQEHFLGIECFAPAGATCLDHVGDDVPLRREHEVAEFPRRDFLEAIRLEAQFLYDAIPY